MKKKRIRHRKKNAYDIVHGSKGSTKNIEIKQAIKLVSRVGLTSNFTSS